MELLLLKEGVPLDAVSPSTEVHTVEEERYDVEASLRRLSPATASAIVTGSIALGTLVAFETGVLSVLVASVAVALGVGYVSTWDDPRPVTKTHKVTKGGLPEQKLMRYLVMANELQLMENEEREKARKDAERQYRSQNGLRGGRF